MWLMGYQLEHALPRGWQQQGDGASRSGALVGPIAPLAGRAARAPLKHPRTFLCDQRPRARRWSVLRWHTCVRKAPQFMANVRANAHQMSWNVHCCGGGGGG